MGEVELIFNVKLRGSCSYQRAVNIYGHKISLRYLVTMDFWGKKQPMGETIRRRPAVKISTLKQPLLVVACVCMDEASVKILLCLFMFHFLKFSVSQIM